MKTFHRNAFIILLLIIVGCEPQYNTMEMDKELINKEIKQQFNQLVLAINNLDTIAWAEFFSKDEFKSAFVGTDLYNTRSEFINAIESYFANREYQNLQPIEIHITALSPELALMTSQEKTEMRLKSGEEIKAVHIYSMIWKKEQDGWKIIHSSESWTNE
ncbi:MAG: nuclear transport factor 2 family protein [Bacteroidetes bacterium]|nr:nuclear transport factor 2 family protein [Bacteroidota bacterium]